MAYTENDYHTLTDSLPQLMWTADPTGNVKYANKRCVEYTGVENEVNFSNNWTTFIHPEDLPAIKLAWLRSIETGRSFNEEYRMRDSYGVYHWFLGMALPIKNKIGKIENWVGSATDIDVQKQSIEKLEHERVLREQFVATLSHDLKNPLSAAKTAAQMIEKYSTSPDRLMGLSKRVINNLNRAGHMIDNLLDANRIKAGFGLDLKLGNVELCKLVSETLNELSTIHGDRFILKTTDLKISGYWSEDGIRRVVENLCSNAIKYGSKSEKVSIKLMKDEDYVSISVHNFGNSFTTEENADLFSPFQRNNTKENDESKGWGLGLTIVKGVAEALGGHVSVVSSKSEGTTFTFKIPDNHRIA